MTAVAVKDDKARQIELATLYGRELVQDVARNAPELFEETTSERGYKDGGFKCRVCGLEIRPKRSHSRKSATNFARSSHAAKHGRDGTAYSYYGGADGWHIMPTEAAIVAEVERRKRVRDEKPIIAAMQQRVKPLFDEMNLVNREGVRAEARILAIVRENGAAALTTLQAHDDAVVVAECWARRESLRIEADRIVAEYPPSVQKALTLPVRLRSE